MEAVRGYLAPVTQTVNDIFKNKEPWQILLISCGTTIVAIKLRDFLFQHESLKSRMKRTIFSIVRQIPSVKKKIESEMNAAVKDVNKAVLGSRGDHGGLEFITKLPDIGLSHNDVIDKLTIYQKQGEKDLWKNGWLSGVVYSGEDKLTKLSTQVFGMFSLTNPLHPDVFPDIRQMEAEVVRMCCTMFHGGPDTCGTTSSGGTESLLLACLAYRNLAYSKGIQNPEIIASINIHAAIYKAAAFFRIRLKKIPLDPDTMTVDLKKMRRAITGSTCMLVCSTPDFPYGQIDPVADIAEMGLQYGIPVHVDACLGGFLISFMDKAGFPLEPFDFRLEGVTSISCDTHKYGFSTKGTSVILYRDKSYRKHQFSCETSWRGGIYATATIAGSRPGSVIAVCWATMMLMGENSYVTATRDIVTTTRYIGKRLREISEIKVLGDPKVCVVAFSSDDINMFQLSSVITTKGWHLITLQHPPGLHICVTLPHTLPGVADRFIDDVKGSVQYIKDNPQVPCDEKAKIYGIAQNIPDRSLVEDVAMIYLDALYSTKYAD